MSISIDLRMLAKKIETSSDELLSNASDKGPEILDKVASAIVAASSLLEEVADNMETESGGITAEHLEGIAALAAELDKYDDSSLKKKASVLDELLLSIGSTKFSLAQSRKASEDEINRLRAEKRKQSLEECYEAPREAHSEMRDAKNQAKAVEQQVKRYMPLEAPLQTRYPPDRPGGQMTRITDHVYQDIDTGIVYDFKNGYKTQKGNEIPGGGVENQTREFGDWNNGNNALFSTRESIMGRFANKNSGMTKKASAKIPQEDVNKVIKATLSFYPEAIDGVMDVLYDHGASSDIVGEALAAANVDVSNADVKRVKQFKKQELTPEEQKEQKEKFEDFLAELSGCDSAKEWLGPILKELVSTGCVTGDDIDFYKALGVPYSYETKQQTGYVGTKPFEERERNQERPTVFDVSTASLKELKKVLAQEISFEDEDEPVELALEDKPEEPSKDTDALTRKRGLKDQFYKLQDVRSNPDLTNPKEDLEGWVNTYHDVQEQMEIDGDFQEYLADLDKGGEFKKIHQKDQNLSLNKDAYSKSKVGYIIKEMNDRGFASPWDFDVEAPNGGKMWWQVADILLNPEKDTDSDALLQDLSDIENWKDYYTRNKIAVPLEQFQENIDELNDQLNRLIPSIEKRIDNLTKFPRMPESFKTLTDEQINYLSDKVGDNSINDAALQAGLKDLTKQLNLKNFIGPSEINEIRRAWPYREQYDRVDILKNEIRVALYHRTINGLLDRLGYPPRYNEDQDMSTKEFEQKANNILKNR
jgi:hypothetical protein